MKRNAGFTLIELAIVLVVVGLLLGGVLKGQELIGSAKVKSLTSELKNLQTYMYTYQDKFRALPGDDRSAAIHVGGTNAAGTQNASIDGVWNGASLPAASETELFWQHVRLAGLANGSTNINTAGYYPRNTEGGRIGVQSSATLAVLTNMPAGHAGCMDGLSSKLVTQMDILLDDGETSSGSLRAYDTAVLTARDGDSTASINAAPAASYAVCLAF
ncbi:prepilin-type N-terminal cleavage/methylation domain-containing protein [Pseudomethylobacillus aquaticus]|uniref:Prepilin-type N-terminal cleavage/methylation domain-containing protein n=1 Tax=Pseudomethylobacillus aquaticus TaxID=2676064 RepID=A0A3N0UZA5_9PROT|nr:MULTISPECIES: prepilin-type N-terminal cleavage/methylation domain-containing protein [Methylophilaceae]ROH85877.1 prepilin-type N-terminal cleavage/methylation domain-containing protein [Pseudomethylobacillus aquaticus]